MTSRDLPEDLVVEILSRVPAVSLARLRSTCKEWNAMIKDGRLAKINFANAPKHSLVLVLIEFRIYLLSVNLHGIHNHVTPSVKVTWQFSLKDPNNSLEEIDIHFVFDHSNGLLLCRTKDNILIVWNPFSGETKWIQHQHRINSNKRCHFYSLGYDNKSSCYKILSMDVSYNRTIHQTECGIYDFTSGSWRGVGVITDWFLVSSLRGVFVNGNAYWLATRRNYANDFLLSFDFSTERFQSFSLQLEGDRSDSHVTLSVTREGQQLCMLVTNNESARTYVWMATKSENTGVMSWSKFLTVSRADITYNYQFRDGMSFLADQEKKVILSCNYPCRFSKDMIHIVGEDIYVELDHHGVKPSYIAPSPNPLLLFCYIPSLVQI